LEAVRLLEAFLAGQGVRLAEADRTHIEAFLADLLARWKPATAANRYRSLKVFYAWLEDEGEVAADPMAKMKPLAIPEQPIPVLPDETLRRLFAVCAGKDFEARRDTAMIMLLVDSGARRAELVGLKVEDLDFEHDVARVIGKGRRERALPFGRKTAVALDRYLRIRSRHAHAASPWLWLGQKGPLTATGLAQMLWRRGRQAGIEACTLINSATRSPMRGSPKAALKRTSCGSRAGGHARCSSGMAPQPPTPGPARLTDASRRLTDCNSPQLVRMTVVYTRLSAALTCFPLVTPRVPC
jgi:site-specific recombinase XerD